MYLGIKYKRPNINSETNKSREYSASLPKLLILKFKFKNGGECITKITISSIKEFKYAIEKNLISSPNFP